MIEYFYGFLALLLASVPGFWLLSAIDHQRELTLLEKLPLSYGVGLAMIAWEMLLLQLVGLGFNLPLILLTLLGFTSILYGSVRLHGFRRRRTFETRICDKAKKLSKPDLFFLSAVLLELAYAFFRALITPMESYDAVTIWGLKGKAIYLAESIPTGFLQNKDYVTSHGDYPLLIPLSQSYVYTFLGNFNDFIPKMIFPFFLLACLSLFYLTLRRVSVSRHHSLVFTFMLATIPHFNLNATTGYVDIVVAFYSSFGAVYLYLWIQDRRSVFLIVSALLTGMAAMTKNEGLVWCLINSVVLGTLLLWERRGLKLQFVIGYWSLYVSILILVLAPWWIFRFSLDLTNDVLNQKNLAALGWSNLARLMPILYHYQTQFFGLRNWNILWILAFGTLLIRFRQIWRSDVKWLVLTVFLIFSGYTSIYLITPYSVAPFDVLWHLRTSASRLFIHFVPLIVLVLARIYSEPCGGEPSPGGR
jgi:hypothetical protein